MRKRHTVSKTLDNLYPSEVLTTRTGGIKRHLDMTFIPMVNERQETAVIHCTVIENTTKYLRK